LSPHNRKSKYISHFYHLVFSFFWKEHEHKWYSQRCSNENTRFSSTPCRIQIFILHTFCWKFIKKIKRCRYNFSPICFWNPLTIKHAPNHLNNCLILAFHHIIVLGSITCCQLHIYAIIFAVTIKFIRSKFPPSICV